MTAVCDDDLGFNARLSTPPQTKMYLITNRFRITIWKSCSIAKLCNSIHISRAARASTPALPFCNSPHPGASSADVDNWARIPTSN